jgi:DNA-binding transcriptional regulator YiaG
MAKVFRDEIAMVCHEMMEDLHKDGIVNDAKMREFEKNCFVQTPEPATKNPIEQGRPTVKPPVLAAAG